MKVFISWSGNRSREMATQLATFLPSVLQFVQPWFSPEELSPGQRWESEIAKQLEVSNFGILCVTPENLTAPWMLFEAGALAKSITDSYVIPLLLDLEIRDITGPLTQFQAEKVDRKGLLNIIRLRFRVSPHAEQVPRITIMDAYRIHSD